MKKWLFKSVSISLLLLVTFFSFFLKSDAASFQYRNFNWEEFSEQHKNYWTSFCDEEDDDCEDRVLATKKRFYIRLYSLLSTMQNKGYFIDDNYIIATVFFGLDGESFKDPSEEDYSPYSLDDSNDSSTKNSYIGSDDGNASSAKDYFEKEIDSLKSLINNFIGYRSTCYGISNETPETYTDSQGNSYQKCSTSNFIVEDGKCLDEVEIYNGTFFDSLGLSFLGSENERKCNEKISELGYSSKIFKTSSTKEVNVDFYWSFLENSRYLDNKEHLEDYYLNILNKVGKNSMKDLTSDELNEYKEEIIEVRKRIIRGIKDVLKNYEGISEQYNTASKNMYWWPIGSDETNESNGIIFASGLPSKLTVSSPYGLRTHPITSVPNSKHNGIDIPGDLGVTNVIASKDGVISSVVSNCVDGGDGSCGGGFGNHIIIQHIDNNYTIYAHLANGSVDINVGDSVKQGQVIGKVGNSGTSSGAHLHFEVRVGGNDSTSAQDPLNYVSADTPRPSGTSSQILEWIGNMEGTGPMEGDNYKVYADSGGVLTVGHGITLRYNADQFRAHGINPETLSLGSLVPKVVVDAIYQEDLNGRFDNIRGMLSTKGVTLNENQIAALASLQFNCGNINGFFENYASYGASQLLCTNWWEQKALHDAKGNYLDGLKKRRIAECDLFVNGNYNMNVYG